MEPWSAVEAQNEDVEAQMEAWRACMSAVADWHPLMRSRIRIRIEEKSWIWIRVKVKSWIRIRI
jgi:hypothetical protein